MADEVDVVLAWHGALNAGDPDGLAALTDEAVEVGGPRGTGHGVALVRDWAGRAGVRLDPGRVFHRGDAVVVEEVARWRDPETGGWGEPLAVASAFQVADGRVRRVARFADLGAALAFSGLDLGDLVPTAGRDAGAVPTGNEASVRLVTQQELAVNGDAREFEGYRYGDVAASFLLVEAAPGSGPRLHRHPYAEVFVVQEGRVAFTVGEATIEAAGGDVVVVPPGAPHRFVNTGAGPLRQLDIHASDRFVTEWLDG